MIVILLLFVSLVSREECSYTPIHNFLILYVKISRELFSNEMRRENFSCIKHILDKVYNLQ
jgi:hypothetical protein